MQLGTLIRYTNPHNWWKEQKNKGRIGLVVGFDPSGQGSPNIKGRGMALVLFVGYKLTRWVHEQDLEVINEKR